MTENKLENNIQGHRSSPDIAKTKRPSKGKEGVFENYRMFISYFSTSVEDKGGR